MFSAFCFCIVFFLACLRFITYLFFSCLHFCNVFFNRFCAFATQFLSSLRFCNVYSYRVCTFGSHFTVFSVLHAYTFDLGQTLIRPVEWPINKRNWSTRIISIKMYIMEMSFSHILEPVSAYIVAPTQQREHLGIKEVGFQKLFNARL